MRIINTSDGSHTIYLTEIDEQYHSVNGAITESNYVYIGKGYDFHTGKNPKVFEIGFGTGLNCLLTALRAEQEKRPTYYITIEKYPLEKKIIEKLNFGKLISTEAQILFEKIHVCKWDEIIGISEYFNLLKIYGDLIDINLTQFENCDVIYFDAFGPDKQPEMWTPVIFRKIHSITSSKGIIVTYSAKGEVRRQLTASGFEMERLPGPPGKNQMLRGIKKEAKI
ncbi:MAG TPA: tRNA (5-methylaminomethyl-2-thiouridine)(34)-methyltransferase MnmD [Draconibacterium sp.]|nr:tRNA (5-methylaminomethyl-2-thiouridine)(34)-methyltransferase MnmD [Draconibacterium sp.]